MNIFEPIRRFIVPSELVDEADRLLREAGAGGMERFVLLSGVVTDDTFQVQTLHAPKQTAYKLSSGLCVRVDGSELHRLNVWLYENSERLAIQVHSHPTEAYHSDTDDAFPMVTTRGGLSLVVPDFAQRGLRGSGTALYRLTGQGWAEIEPVEARTILQLC